MGLPELLMPLLKRADGVYEDAIEFERKKQEKARRKAEKEGKVVETPAVPGAPIHEPWEDDWCSTDC